MKFTFEFCIKCGGRAFCYCMCSTISTFTSIQFKTHFIKPTYFEETCYMAVTLRKHYNVQAIFNLIYFTAYITLRTKYNSE
jgi:hypothetical protein